MPETKRGHKEVCLRVSLLQIAPYKTLRYKRSYFIFPNSHWANLPGSEASITNILKNMGNLNKPTKVREIYLNFVNQWHQIQYQQ